MPDIENTTTTTYNGWTNYATWRINLEIVSDYMNTFGNDLADEYVFPFAGLSALADHLREYAFESVLVETDEDTLQYGYAMAFLDQVNWYEIAKSYADDNPGLIADQN